MKRERTCHIVTQPFSVRGVGLALDRWTAACKRAVCFFDTTKMLDVDVCQHSAIAESDN